MARSGDISFTTTAEAQIEKGRLSEVEIISQIYDHKLYNESDNSIPYNEAYAAWIVLNEDRNRDFVIKPALEMVREGRHVLVLFQFIAHGELLRDMFYAAGIPESDVRFIYGQTKNEVRKRAITEFRKGEFKILIGSTIFDAGVNIPIISGMVLAGAGNSDITLIQRIGRSVRTYDYEDEFGDFPEFVKSTDGIKVAKVIDVYDINVKFFENQARNRYNIARGEFGAKRVSVIGKITRASKVKSLDPSLSFEEAERRLEEMGSSMGAIQSDLEFRPEDDILNCNIDDVMSAFSNMMD